MYDLIGLAFIICGVVTHDSSLFLPGALCFVAQAIRSTMFPVTTRDQRDQ